MRSNSSRSRLLLLLTASHHILHSYSSTSTTYAFAIDETDNFRPGGAPVPASQCPYQPVRTSAPPPDLCHCFFFFFLTDLLFTQFPVLTRSRSEISQYPEPSLYDFQTLSLLLPLLIWSVVVNRVADGRVLLHSRVDKVSSHKRMTTTRSRLLQLSHAP